MRALSQGQIDRLRHLAELPENTYIVARGQLTVYRALERRGLITIKPLPERQFVNGDYRTAAEVQLTAAGLVVHLRSLTSRSGIV